VGFGAFGFSDFFVFKRFFELVSGLILCARGMSSSSSITGPPEAADV
jgi:hypothetical protein